MQQVRVSEKPQRWPRHSETEVRRGCLLDLGDSPHPGKVWVCSRAGRHTRMSDGQPLTPQSVGSRRMASSRPFSRKPARRSLTSYIYHTQTGAEPNATPAPARPTSLWVSCPERKREPRKDSLRPSVFYIFFPFKTNFIEI